MWRAAEAPGLTNCKGTAVQPGLSATRDKRQAMRHLLIPTFFALLLSACGGLPGTAPPPGPAQGALVPPAGAPQGTIGQFRPRPRMVAAAAPLQCVPYARASTGIDLRGDAWTWWKAAKDRYRRGNRPQVGSVLVVRRKGRSLGHLAVVTAILNDRQIVADHANWLNQGRIHLETPIVDVSPGNDWSAVRVWYTPGGHYGTGVYPAHGFIYPDGLQQAGG